MRRVDRNRAVSVTASVDPSATSAGAVTSELQRVILPEVLAGFPGVTYSFEGAQAQQAEQPGPEHHALARPARAEVRTGLTR